MRAASELQCSAFSCAQYGAIVTNWSFSRIPTDTATSSGVGCSPNTFHSAVCQLFRFSKACIVARHRCCSCDYWGLHVTNKAWCQASRAFVPRWLLAECSQPAQRTGASHAQAVAEQTWGSGWVPLGRLTMQQPCVLKMSTTTGVMHAAVQHSTRRGIRLVQYKDCTMRCLHTGKIMVLAYTCTVSYCSPCSLLMQRIHQLA